MNKKPPGLKTILPPNRLAQPRIAPPVRRPEIKKPTAPKTIAQMRTAPARSLPNLRTPPAAQLKSIPVRKPQTPPPPAPSRDVVQPALGAIASVAASAAAAPALPVAVGVGVAAAVFGYQEVRINQPRDDAASTISDARWRRLTGGISRARYYWGGRPLVDALFQNFLNAGFRYHLMRGLVIQLVGRDLDRYGGDAEGNCFSYAKTFARLLTSVGIDAEPREVRQDSEGRFITRVDRFIDARVRGHIYYRDRLVPHYYMFNSHVAVWVPSLRMYYDPMACTKYANFHANLIVEVDGADERHLRTRTAPPFARGRVNLEVTGADEDGGFRRVIATDLD